MQYSFLIYNPTRFIRHNRATTNAVCSVRMPELLCRPLKKRLVSNGERQTFSISTVFTTWFTDLKIWNLAGDDSFLRRTSTKAECLTWCFMYLFLIPLARRLAVIFEYWHFRLYIVARNPTNSSGGTECVSSLNFPMTIGAYMRTIASGNRTWDGQQRYNRHLQVIVCPSLYRDDFSTAAHRPFLKQTTVADSLAHPRRYVACRCFSSLIHLRPHRSTS